MNRQAGHIVPQGLLRQPLTALPKLGPKRAQQLGKLGLCTIGDLLTLFPRDYEDRRTLRAIREKGLECRGIILNQQSEEWDTAAVTNRAMIEEYTGLPVLAELINGEDELDSAAILG